MGSARQHDQDVQAGEKVLGQLWYHDQVTAVFAGLLYKRKNSLFETSLKRVFCILSLTKISNASLRKVLHQGEYIFTDCHHHHHSNKGLVFTNEQLKGVPITAPHDSIKAYISCTERLNTICHIRVHGHPGKLRTQFTNGTMT